MDPIPTSENVMGWVCVKLDQEYGNRPEVFKTKHKKTSWHMGMDWTCGLISVLWFVCLVMFYEIDTWLETVLY